MVLQRVCAPAWAFTLVRTTTEVRGSPPKNPETMLPAPCASSSRLVGVTRFRGSRRSAASMLSRLSRLAIRANVSAVAQTAGWLMASHRGTIHVDDVSWGN